MSVRTKVGLGFNNYIRETELGSDDYAFSVVTTNSKDVKGRPLFNRFAKADSMKDVPPPLSGDHTSLSDHINLDESQMSYGTKSSTFSDSKSVSNDFVSYDDSDKSLEVNTNDFASSDSSVKSSEPKPNDSTSCALTSSASTSENKAEIESNVGTPIQESIIVQDLRSFSCNSSDKNENTSRTSCNKNGYSNKKAGHFRTNASFVSKLCFVCGSGTHLIKDCDFYEKQMVNKTVVPTGKPKVTPVPTGKPQVFIPVPTGRLNRPFPVPTDKGCSPSVTSATEDEGIFDSRCSRSMTGNKERLDDFHAFHEESDHLGKFDENADEGYIFGYSASNKAYKVYNVPNKRVKESMNLRFLEEKPNQTNLQTHKELQIILQPIDTPGDKVDDSPFSSADKIFQKELARLKDTPGDKVDDSPFSSADKIFQKELARLKGEERRDTSYTNSPTLGTINNVEDLQTPPSAQPVPPGELTFFLGLQVQQRPDGIFIHQDKYVQEILNKFDLESVKTATTPYEAPRPKSKNESDSPVNVHLYRSMIGSLMYWTASRPDIMFAISVCSRHQVTPTTSNLEAVKKIFKYLKGQPKLGLWYPKESPLMLEAYSDSDYAGQPMQLLPAMLLQAQAGGGAEVAEQAVPHPMPSPDHFPAPLPTPSRPQTSDTVALVHV
nr:uncharacterized mitochondrial protein AtMg00810-like [Tanacetum cinerariifolium]